MTEDKKITFELKTKLVENHLYIRLTDFKIVMEKISYVEQENEQLKVQFEKLLDFVADRVEECDVCELTDTCINSEGVCPFARSNRNIKDLIKKHINGS